MTKLSLRGLTRRFAGVAAVDGIDLDIAPGEFVSLLGPSGCGKTTTLRMIAGFIDPSAGTIEMDGRVLSSPAGSVRPEKRQMSMIFQSYAIWPNMTVFQNVAFGLKIRKASDADIRRRVGKILDIMRMADLGNRYPAELSGGQQQRVALARAIVIEPQVLLLDEPLSNLDASLREEMRFEIKRMHEEFKITSVYVTHDQAEAMVTSDRIAVMNKGRIEQCDPPFVVYTRPKSVFVANFIGRTNILQAQRAGTALRFDGFSVAAGALEPGSSLSFSLRPQSLVLSSSRPDVADNVVFAATIVQRSFLGEGWDYIVVPAQSTLTLRAWAPSMTVFDVGQQVFVAVAPSHLVPVA